jgi:hypothetical protein
MIRTVIGVAAVLASLSGLGARVAAAQANTRCAPSRGNTESSREEQNGELKRWRASWSGDNCRVDLRAIGDVKFNSDFSDITSVASGGSFDLTTTDGSTTRRLTLRRDGRDALERRWVVNGKERAWDDEGHRWLAAFLIDIDRTSGAGIDYRFPSLVAAGGTRAVLDEVEKMYGDYPRSLYLRRAIDTGKLNDSEYQRAVAIVGKDFTSDYEMSRVLRDVSEHASLDNDTMRHAYLAVVDRMTSDYECSRVLQTVFMKSSMSRELASGAIRAARSFTSDYERSRVLLAAIENKALDADDATTVLETVTRSTSDYEKSRVMLAVASRWTLNGDARKAYLRAADTIHSDYENRRVLAALVRQEAR